MIPNKIEFEKVEFEDEIISKRPLMLVNQPVALCSTNMVRNFPVHKDEFKVGDKVKITITKQ